MFKINSNNKVASIGCFSCALISQRTPCGLLIMKENLCKTPAERQSQTGLQDQQATDGTIWKTTQFTVVLCNY